MLTKVESSLQTVKCNEQDYPCIPVAWPYPTVPSILSSFQSLAFLPKTPPYPITGLPQSLL